MTHRLTVFAAAGALLLAAAPAALVATPSAVLAQAARAHGDPQAEAFVQGQANRVLQILSNPGMGVEAKKAVFRQIIDQVADVPRITSFVLGRYRRIVTPAQYSDFSAAFKTYAENVYESRLNEYKGQTLQVTGSVVRQPGDVVVSSQIIGGPGQPAQVNWRVLRGADGQYRAVDVQVAGIWLAITEQQDFVSTLDNHSGDINLLINQLRNGTASARSAGRAG
jgi:phospholipid transport system substrate-binding protein